MNAGPPDLSARLTAVRNATASAAGRVGRDAGAVRLIAVVKTVRPEVVKRAVELGIGDLGENRVQEAEGMIARVGRGAARWHMIGHLQRNKAGRALELFDRIHGVDDRDLAGALSRRAVAAGRTMRVLVEVNVAEEPTQFGVAPRDLEGFLGAVAVLPGLELDGLMTVGPPVASPEEARPRFARLRELRDGAERSLGLKLPELSMGMSGDFEVAVEEGATMVRVGSALFGPREVA